MDTGVVITQEPVFTKTSIEEAHAGVVLEHSTMDVDKVNLSTILDDSRTSTIEEKPEIAEVLNGPGNKETEESKHEKEEVVKTISIVEDSKMVKEKERETETDEQGTVFVHQPKNTDDAKVILTDVKQEKEKEEVSVETETKNSQEQEKDISKAVEEIPTIKTDEVEEEKDSRTVETSVNGTEAEHNETVSVEEFTRNGENIMKETAPEQETTTHVVETTERILVEAEKDETETVNTVVKDTIANNEETTVPESISLKENEDTVEAIKNSDDAEQVSREVTGDKEKEEYIIHKEAEVQESPTVIQTPTIQGEDTESKASKETEEHEHVLVRDIPQDETLVDTKAETVDTSTVQESAVLKTLETKSVETDTEPRLDLKEEEETVTPSDEVLVELPKPSPDQRSIDTEEDEHVLGSKMPQQGEAGSLVIKEDKEQEKTENFEVPIDLALKVDREELMDEKKEADQVAGAQSIEEKIQEKAEEEEEVSPHQEGQEEGSYGSEKVPVPESIESCLPVEKDEEVKSDDVIQVSSASPEGETLVEAKKIEVIKANDEEEQLAVDKTQSILDTEPVKSNEETTVHESIVSHEVTGDREKEEDIIIHKAQEVPESLTVVETPTIQGEDIELKASEDTEEHEHVLVRDIPQEETLVPKAETVNTPTVHVSGEPSLDLKEQEEVKTVTSSDEVQQSITLMEPPKLSPEQISKDTKEDEHVLERSMPQGEIFVTEAESLVTKESKETVMDLKEQEKTEKLEEVPSDLALEVDKEEVMEEKKEAVDDVAGDQNMERGLELNESEAELVEKQSIESPSEETSKTLDEKIQEEVSSHQEVQEEGSYELKEKSQEERSLDLTPLQEESCLPLEQNEEEIKEQIHKHEQENEEVKSDEVTQISSGSPKGESVVEAKKKEEIKANEEEQVVRTETVNTVVKDPEIVSNEETAVHDLKENEEAVEAIKNADDAEQVSREVTGDKEKEEDIIHKEAEVQESPTVIQTPTIQGEDNEPKASKETEEHEHVLVRDIPQEETLVPKEETVNTSTVHVSGEPSLDLKEQEETVKTVTSSDEVQQSITLMEPPKLSPEKISKDTKEDEHVLERSMPQGEIFVTEAESLVTKENKEAVMDLKEEEKTEKLEEVPSDLALEVDKEEVMEEKKEAVDVAGDQNMERGLELNESEAELVDLNITDETEEKLVEKQSIESPSEEKSKTLDEKIQEEVLSHQEVQEEGSYVLKEKSQEERSLDLTPLQEESCFPLEQNEEEIKEQIHKHEQENEEVKSDEVTQVSSGSVVEAKKIEEIKANEEEKVVADKIQSVLETVDTEPVKSNEDDIAESLNSAGEEIQTESKDGEIVQTDETGEEKASRTPETSVNGTEDEHIATVLEGISKNNESIVPDKTSEEIKNSDEAEENLHKVTGDREKEDDIMTWKTTEEMHEENTTMEHESLLVRDVPQIDTLVTEAEDVNTSTVHKFESNEAEVGQETKKDTEPSFDLKEDQEKEETETVISSDEVRPSDQVDDIQTDESVEVKPQETLQGESTEENLLDVPSADSETFQPETVLVPKTESQDTVEDIPSDLVLKEEVKDDKTEVDGGTQVMGETRDLELNEPEAEQTDQTKTDEKLLVESVEKMQTSSLEFPYEEKTTTVDEKMEEVTLQQEKSDEVIKVSSVSPSEEQEGEIIIDAVKLEDNKTEEEQVAGKIKNSLEPLEPQSLMPSYSEEQEHKTISEKTEDEKVKEEEPSVQILSEEDETKSHVTEAETEVRDTQQGETIDEPESVDTSTVQEAVVLNTLETKINESEAVHSATVGEEEERQVTRKDIEPSFEMTEDQEKETIISSDEVAKILDEPSEKMPSLESPSEETSKTADEKIEEEVTLHQESEETVTVPSELGVQAKEEEETKEKMSEEDSTSAVEEKTDQVSSAPLSEEPEAEKMEDLKENEEEQVAEAVEPHSSPPEKSDTVAEKVKETEPMGDTGTGSSSKLVEEEKLKQDKEILEVPSSETIPQETLSDDVTETHEEEAQTRDIEPFVTDKHQEEEQANEESPRKKVISAEEGEIQTREPEEENMVDSSEKNNNETLIAETKKEDEDETVGLDASKTSENECSKQEEFENLETPKVEEVSETIEEIETTGGDQSPSFITELEDQIPKQIKEIHEEEIKEAQAVVDQTSSLVSEQVEEIHEEEEEEETKESHKVEDLSGQNLPVEASQTLSSELDDKTAKQVEEETKAHKLQEEEEEEEETKPKELDDQIETSTDVIKVEDEKEDTKETDTQVAEIMKAQELKGTLQPGAAMEDQDPENSSDDFTFSKSIGDEDSSTLSVVGILKELQTSLEENERGNDLDSINAEPETLEKSLLVLEETPASEIIEANMLQDSTSRELEFNVEETLQEETPSDLSLTQVLPGEKILIPSNQEEGKKQEDLSASTSEKISLQEEDHPGDFEIFNKEHNAEAQETVKEEDQTFDIKEEKKNEELQDEKLSTLYATRETDETSSPEVNNNNNQEDASELGVGHDSATTPQVEEEKEAHSVLGNDQEVLLTSEKKITEPLSVAEKELTEQHVQAQAVSDDTKSVNEMDFNSEQIPKDYQREEAEETADSLITSENFQLQDLSKGFGQEKQQSTDLTYVQEDLDGEIKDEGHDSVLAHKKDSDLIEEKKEVDYVKTEPEDAIKHGVSTQEKNMCEKTGLEATKEIYQEEECKKTDTATGVKEEIKEEEKETTEDSLNSMKNADVETKDYGLDSVVAQKKESGSIEEKKEVDYVKTELEDAVKHGVCTEEEATKEIYEEECKQTNTVTAIKEEMKEEKKDTPEDFLNSMKNTDDATEKSKPEIQEIDKLSPASETPQKQGNEVPTQQKREIADDVPKMKNLKIAEEVQQKDGEDETEPTVKEPARKSLSDLIQNVKVTDKTEVATTEPHIEEEAKAEGEDEDGDEHKDDKTSPDSIVMVEAKDTVSIIKTQKKSHGILSGVGSKVKHSISKVKKALTGKSSHPTKPSSPQ